MDETFLYAGTEDGFRAVRVRDDEAEVVESGLDGNAVRGIGVDPNAPQRVFVACGLRGWGLHVTDDGGESFESVGFEDRWVWEATFAPDGQTLYVGTEPPMLYASSDDGESFEEFDAIADLPSFDDWTFFHEPFYAGHVHGIGVHPDRPERIFAGVEHGALIYSTDGGKSWQERLVGHDLHRIASDPDDPDRVLAGTGGGLFVSDDAGESFDSNDSLAGKYVHGVYFDPEDSSRAFVYVDGDDPLYRSEDGGTTWHSIGSELPAARPADNLCIHPSDSRTLFYAGDVSDAGEEGDEGSRIFVSDDGGDTWTRLALLLPKVWRMCAVPS